MVTAAGRTRVERGAHVRVRAQEDGVVLEVLVGRAVLLDPKAIWPSRRDTACGSGSAGALIEKIDLKVGAAIVEPLPPEEPPPAVAQAPAAAAAPEPAAAAAKAAAVRLPAPPLLRLPRRPRIPRVRSPTAST